MTESKSFGDHLADGMKRWSANAQDGSTTWATEAGDKVRVWESQPGVWHWHVTAGNGEVLEQGEGHTRREDAVRAAVRYHPAVSS